MVVSRNKRCLGKRHEQKGALRPFGPFVFCTSFLTDEAQTCSILSQSPSFNDSRRDLSQKSLQKQLENAIKFDCLTQPFT